jgi:Domain of unknown function (DUF4954)
LNALIFPAHEQHHNNSFLCAAVVKGQSNMAAGATLGSNHNSRGADGELKAGRGFWPGLSVALKHNSKFASFNLISKGNYPAEIHNPLPFSLLGNDETSGGLLIIAGYWFQYNMYALARNAWKFAARDVRTDKNMLLEYDYLAPDTVSELLQGLNLLELWTGQSLADGELRNEAEARKVGKTWLENPENATNPLAIFAQGIENSKRPTRVAKVHKAYQIFRDLLSYHAAKEWLATSKRNPLAKPLDLLKSTFATAIQQWDNVGGQMIPAGAITELKSAIRTGAFTRWAQVHEFYEKQAELYADQKFENALNGLLTITGGDLLNPDFQKNWISRAIKTSAYLTEGIEKSRAKDFQDPFRIAMYGNEKEMEKVIGDWRDNEFILEAKKQGAKFQEDATELL